MALNLSAPKAARQDVRSLVSACSCHACRLRRNTRLDFQLTTDTQNGRSWQPNFFPIFFRFYVRIGFRDLQIYWHCSFSRETENESMTVILILLILINHSYF